MTTTVKCSILVPKLVDLAVHVFRYHECSIKSLRIRVTQVHINIGISVALLYSR
jgi:hypothetical protein